MSRKWNHIIPFEDRSDQATTINWRLAGIRTHKDQQNTGDGRLWLTMASSGDDVTCALYKDRGVGSADQVATATAVDVSGTDNTGANDAEVTFVEANSSGLSGSMFIRDFVADGTVPVLVALCTDEDISEFFGDIENLPGFDGTAGLATAIRVAHFDVIDRVTKTFIDELGGYGAAEAWYIEDADRTYPDLRRIANPDQLRHACAYRALDIAMRRGHEMGDPTVYSEGAAQWAAQYEDAMGGIRLAFKPGDGDDAEEMGSEAVVHLDRA